MTPKGNPVLSVSGVRGGGHYLTYFLLFCNINSRQNKSGIMKISTKSRYGLAAMFYLKEQDNVVPLRQIAKEAYIPFPYLEKIISILHKEGLVKSKKGPNGGYYLSKKNINLSEIIAPLEGDVMACITKGCPKKSACKTFDIWNKVQIAVYKTLEEIKL